MRSFSFIFAVVGLLGLLGRCSADLDFGNTVFIGDSITEPFSSRPSGDGNFSWRYQFWKRAVDDGVQFQFVGSRTENAGGPTSYPGYKGQSFENRHEAISGTRAKFRAESLAGHYGDLNQDGTNLAADTAFILLGCNDVRSVTPPPSQLTGVRDDVQVIVNGLQAANAKVDVYLISILPRFTQDTDGDGINDLPDGRNDDYQVVNGLLDGLAKEETDQFSSVRFIDVATHASEFWFYDGTHPNGVGETEIGNLVFDFVATPEPLGRILTR